jgi:tight adherence protein B
MALFIAICIFLAVVVILMALMMLKVTAPQREAITRLESVIKAERRGVATLDLKLIRDELLSDVPAFNRLLLKWSWATRIRQFVAQSGGKIKPGKLLLICAVAALLADVATKQYTANPILILGAAGLGAVVPVVVLALKRAHRLRQFEKSFPEAIDLLGRAVRAGHAFSTGLEMIASEMTGPLGAEFRVLFEEQNFGLPMKEAMINLSERMPLIDVRFFVTAALVQRETGGNLAEVLDNLAHVIRERFVILGEVRTKTAQGRLTAAILISLPIGMLVLMRILNPSYVQPLFDDPWGMYLLGGAAIMQVLGALILWKIVSIQV